MAVEKEFIKKTGAWFSYQGKKIGQGRENVKAYLKDNPTVMEELREKILATHGLGSEQGNNAEEILQ